ncbi:circumsporozoite protein-like [Haliaeetus albicilla]|uniref:circumsporozoite protein-like n=1 Tax=Haliaeetus albicilla TaxID=8969 RepID=UPI0037E78C45
MYQTSNAVLALLANNYFVWTGYSIFFIWQLTDTRRPQRAGNVPGPRGAAEGKRSPCRQPGPSLPPATGDGAARGRSAGADEARRGEARRGAWRAAAAGRSRPLPPAGEAAVARPAVHAAALPGGGERGGAVPRVREPTAGIGERGRLAAGRWPLSERRRGAASRGSVRRRPPEAAGRAAAGVRLLAQRSTRVARCTLERKLVCRGCVSNGYDCSKKDLLKHISKGCLDCKMGHFLMENFRVRFKTYFKLFQYRLLGDAQDKSGCKMEMNPTRVSYI